MALKDVVMLDHGKVVGQKPGFIQSTDIVYDNADSDLTANNVQDAIDEVDEKVNDVNERLAKVTTSTSARITLSFNTEYTTLVDGYFRVATPNGPAGAYTDAYVNDAAIIRAIFMGGLTDISGIFVRKGSKIKYDGTSASASQGYFYPLS